MNNKCDGCKFYCNGRCFGEKDAPYVEYADCQGENNRPLTISDEEAIKYLIKPFATSTRSYNEYLKQREAYELAIIALKERNMKNEKSITDMQ